MTENIKAAFAAQPGNLHLGLELPCQDSVAFHRGPSACCLALADGAGSVSGSELAAGAVCRGLARELALRFDVWFRQEDELLKSELLRLCAQFAEEADPGRKPDCTLLLTAISIDGAVLWCHIGDGGLFCCSDTSCIQISSPENGAAANETYFLSGREAHMHLRVGRLRLRQAATFLLCSDGVEPVLYDRQAGHCAPAVGILSGWMREDRPEEVSLALERHLDGLFRSKTDDDMSLGMICWTSPERPAQTGSDCFI